MKQMFSLITAVATVWVALNLPVRGDEKQTQTSEIKIDNFSFTPATLTVHAGVKVTWVNKDDVPHTVASKDKQFKSPALDTDQSFSYTFASPGTYDYYCTMHPKMTGKIIVE